MVSKADIDTVLIDPIEALQFPRAKGLTVVKYKRGLDMLRNKLRYLDPSELDAVADETLVMARQFKAFPSPYLVLESAQRRRIDPLHQAKIDESIRTCMYSRPGWAALNGDYAVEMLLALIRIGHGRRITYRDAEIWKREADDRRHTEMRHCRALIQEADDARAGAEAGTVAQATADTLTENAIAAQERLDHWLGLERRAEALVRSKPCKSGEAA